MRLVRRFSSSVLLNGQPYPASVRPIAGQLEQELYGEYVQDTLRLLLPRNAVVSPGMAAAVDGKPYVCVSVRTLSGHIQADVRRRHG